jgi:hypothetical protein
MSIVNRGEPCKCRTQCCFVIAYRWQLQRAKRGKMLKILKLSSYLASRRRAQCHPITWSNANPRSSWR